MKTYLYNFDPFKPHFYIVKHYTLFFLFLLKNIDCGYSLEPPRRGGSNEYPNRRGGSNEYPQYMFWAEIWKISEFLSENFQFLEVKFSIYLNGRVFVMTFWLCICIKKGFLFGEYSGENQKLIIVIQIYSFECM